MDGAGARDRKVEFLRQVTTRDAFNAPVETYTVIVSAWAEKTPVSDGERVRAQEVAADRTDRFVTPWSRTLAAVDPKHRLRCEGVTYNITGVKEIGRRQGLEFTAMARAEL